MVVNDKQLQEKVRALEARISRLEEDKKQLDLVIQNTGVGIWDWYVQTGETIFNERWANIIGYTLEELSPVSIETWIQHAHPDDLEVSDKLLKEHWEGKSEYYIFQSRMKHKNGHYIWILDTGRVIEWESEGVPRRMIGTHIDITEQKQVQAALNTSNKKLENLIRIDPLTKIFNRRAYEERLESELGSYKRSNSPLSLLLIDVDYFKKYNDTYGHENGDVALINVAKQIKTSLHRKTDFVARYGGEEFVALLPHTNINDSKLIAQKLINDIKALGIEHSSSQYQRLLTISIGISSTDTHPDDLFSAADKALYQAKSNGRDRYEISAD